MEESRKDGEHLIRLVTEKDWPRLEPLWLELYEHQREHGMLIKLPPDAYRLWAESYRPLLGRFGFVFVVEEANLLTGFLAGKLRMLPAHFGGHPVGCLTELFVSDSHRGLGIGERLMSAGINWYREHDVTRCELQVLATNPGARKLYRRLGWVDELVQMIRQEELER
ncbi:MAG TPA: GNAT family N-acetyltransferase [Pyrinomonadaceae bacterium]|nr:GNAT family N-acetyltransferase [Pyrinomonadaceae bacterium]